MFEKNSKAHVILFALVLSVVCSLLITAAATGLRARQQDNMALDKKVNLLRAAGLVDEGQNPGKETINTLYEQRIEEAVVDRQGKIIETENADGMHLYFVHAKDARDGHDSNDISGYIVPINTRGLWGKIHGYLAFKNDGQTVSGFSVFSHSETPGLGGEIESAWFQKNFKGKKIFNSQDKFVSIGIAKGKAGDLPKEEQENYVDGISGATLTGRYLSEGIKNTLMKYEGVSVTFRQRQLKAKDGNPSHD
ncbi:NADH:ubiquinone oxidoreductase subunit C [Desulfobacter hydrogenophilus]|uniref:Na(+)-translocating NADH-quinone reductase subunit C n=1 Tax=Desulfobacter hydrogenophilus TaxID=2291 RepID=A0A328FCE9_9BACT|nr:FMN-binding protein [Desulfobacter hydrogenophilus]NDY73437.1 FMN-binding protein [Desulfobacter hydrogenophilus]QBH12397.1 FMN-binding protein [Desulfobacter hydrogenophilus]RAM00765.1 NADH:ubiquinone oxidoreductase subunit C [Desulfobacter hydrogenophilus]